MQTVFSCITSQYKKHLNHVLIPLKKYVNPLNPKGESFLTTQPMFGSPGWVWQKIQQPLTQGETLLGVVGVKQLPRPSNVYIITLTSIRLQQVRSRLYLSITGGVIANMFFYHFSYNCRHSQHQVVLEISAILIHCIIVPSCDFLSDSCFAKYHISTCFGEHVLGRKNNHP